jgi:hypothetical protein
MNGMRRGSPSVFSDRTDASRRLRLVQRWLQWQWRVQELRRQCSLRPFAMRRLRWRRLSANHAQMNIAIQSGMRNTMNIATAPPKPPYSIPIDARAAVPHVPMVPGSISSLAVQHQQMYQR